MFAPIESSIERNPDEVENPAVGVFLEHWAACAGNRWAPAWPEVDIMALPSPLIPYVLVCDVTADEDFVYRYWGRGHTAYHGKDYSRKRLSEMRPTWVRDFLAHQYMRVIETRELKIFETRYDGVPEPVYSVRLPLSADGENVTSIFSLAQRGDYSEELSKWIDTERKQRSNV